MAELTENWKHESTPPRVVVVGMSEIQALMDRGWQVQPTNAAFHKQPDYPIYFAPAINKQPAQWLMLGRQDMSDPDAQCQSEWLTSLRCYESDLITQQFLRDLICIRQIPAPASLKESALTNG